MKNVLLYILTALSVFAGATNVRSEEISSASMGLARIAEGVYSYVDVKSASPQNSFGANAGIIIGKDGIVAIDTLVSAKEAKRFIRDIRVISDKPIRYVINTHYHLDHAFGNAEFVKLGAVVISQTKDAKNLLKVGEAALSGAKNYGLTDADMEGTELSHPSLTFTDRMEIDLGDQRIELIYPGPSHTDGSILIHLPDRKVLFAGDLLFTNCHPFLAEGDIGGWLKALDYIVTMDVSSIIPGHGPVSTRKDVEDMKYYLVIFDKMARELTAQSGDISFIVAEMKKALPQRTELESLIQANIQGKYLKK